MGTMLMWFMGTMGTRLLWFMGTMLHKEVEKLRGLKAPVRQHRTGRESKGKRGGLIIDIARFRVRNA